MTCPTRQENDEYVCMNRGCGRRWTVGEVAPECPVDAQSRATVGVMTAAARDHADRLYSAWLRENPAHDPYGHPYDAFLWLTLNYRISAK